MTQKNLDYTGFTNLAIFEDGSWISPAQDAYGETTAIAIWTTQGYQVREGLETVTEFCDRDGIFLDPESGEK